MSSHRRHPTRRRVARRGCHVPRLAGTRRHGDRRHPAPARGRPAPGSPRTVRARVRQRSDRHGAHRHRRALPPREPGAVRDRGVRTGRARAQDVPGHHLPRRPRDRRRPAVPGARRPHLQLLDGEALRPRQRSRGVGQPVGSPRARLRRVAALLHLTDRGRLRSQAGRAGAVARDRDGPPAQGRGHRGERSRLPRRGVRPHHRRDLRPYRVAGRPRLPAPSRHRRVGTVRHLALRRRQRVRHVPGPQGRPTARTRRRAGRSCVRRR